MKWMFSWQIYQMYVRYFLWNYVGRYNDADGQQSTDSTVDGNWTSGILDGGKHLPKSIVGGGTPILGQGLQLGYAYTPLYRPAISYWFVRRVSTIFSVKNVMRW